MKNYIKNLQKPLFGVEKEAKKTIDKYNLISKGEKVIIALSGGKDSASLLYILHKLGFKVEGLMIDLHLGKWSEIHKKNMELFCFDLGVKLHVVDLKKEFGHGICFIKQIVKEKKNLSGCTVCGVIKRWVLNKWAKKLGADKLATGHNLDDECQTVLMNFLKGNLYLGINSIPMTGIMNGDPPSPTNYPSFAQRIKPFFFTAESKIRKYAEKMQFPILYDRCPCAIGTYRVKTRAWLKEIEDKHKLKIVENFQKVIRKLRGKREVKQANSCRICGEPSRKETCNACGMFMCLQGKS
jgi:uncharacterized protein (TIGR00269 family)